MPACGPVRLMAGTPSPWRAIDSSVAAWCSPVARRTSSSRGSGSSVIAAARPSSSSVVSPMAETTTTRSWPAARSRAIRRATRLMRSASATEEPPYFWTTRGAGIAGHSTARVTALRPCGMVAGYDDPAVPAPRCPPDVLRSRQSAADRADRRRRTGQLAADAGHGRRQPCGGVPGAGLGAGWCGRPAAPGRPRPPPVLRGAGPPVRGARDRCAGHRLVRPDGARRRPRRGASSTCRTSRRRPGPGSAPTSPPASRT